MEKNFDFERAKRRYNRLMCSLCLEYLTIGTSYSEGTDGWNIRDMVSECAFQYEKYLDEGTMQGSMRYGDKIERREWRSEAGRLKRFIEYYEVYIYGVVCKFKHGSIYDNKRGD